MGFHVLKALLAILDTSLATLLSLWLSAVEHGRFGVSSTILRGQAL
jgi:hypothetical protein